MTLQKWFRLYGITLLLGIVVILLTGLLRLAFDTDFENNFSLELNQTMDYVYFMIFLILFGSIYGTFSHIMFFSFLVVNLMGKGVIHYRFLWQGVQLIIVISILGIYMGYLEKMYLPVIVIAFTAALVAYFKAKVTNYTAFIPTFFFMAVGTLVAMIPTWSDQTQMLFILPAVLVCNTWQIMQLHQIVGKPAEKTAG